ncbi:glycoside hydrolase family 2 TIM barrel-domain containing protein [Curtobacterium sp. APC 4022]|uniref:glycoside hydrolase family 2 protein n=1 Tax=Curtobacterium sp. APC 4022 TaxID=3035201 RepID=UPI0025B2D306|nr:glycoside hydrolase family 2 TIM barrel-domain containing protein [Curtobacterium sp. APC 4022]MDN3478191.1 glycoside hydrolase family 2 TIM barrel-domain containing protein [Curtobacterium sp. APC 4022]
MNAHLGNDAAPVLPLASRQDGEYPRPQMMRSRWADLDGTWSFRNTGDDPAWRNGFPDARDIRVPFPPESVASGIDEPGFHPVVWYSRQITAADLTAAGFGADAPRVLAHFGAVDHRARVWIDGQFIGEHEGGHTPFTLDVTEALAGGPNTGTGTGTGNSGADTGGTGSGTGTGTGSTDSTDSTDTGSTTSHTLVVRAEDDPHDLTQPRGKQDWHEQAHDIWYRRTTGIWQTVWLEAVPTTAIRALRWTNVDHETMRLTVRLTGERPAGTRLRVEATWTEHDEHLATVETTVSPTAHECELVVPIARQANGQAEQELQWSPDTPRLVDAVVTLVTPTGAAADAVSSYFGVRTTRIGGGRFLLNDRSIDVRSVLNQGYWPDSHLTAPTRQALRREVELIKELGFNAARNHQKIEDPRFLYWADRLGLMVWGEAPGAYAFSPTAVQRLMREWMDAVERDASHPSIVTWVPANESWGVQHIATDPAQQAYARALADVTRALDATRPVISNDGWEHPDSDILSVHDYEGDGDRLARTYADDAARTRLLAGLGPADRLILVGGAVDRGQPVMLTEFGGVNHQHGAHRDDAWGYTTAADGDDWIARVTALYDAVRASSFLAGSCWTQLTDTMQETNGLLNADRTPKEPIERIRRAVLGH